MQIAFAQLSAMRGQRIRAAAAGLLVMLALQAGCHRTESTKVSPPISSVPAQPAAVLPSTTVATAPSSQPATQAAAVLPATPSQPVIPTLLVNQIIEQFPEARLRVITSGEHVTAVLYSADPANAINDDYKGNSFYLTMAFPEVKDETALDGVEWRFKSTTSESVDTTEGIFLSGFRYHLQPMDVIVRIEGTGPTRKIRLAGQFLSFDSTTPHQPGALTPVGGELEAELEVPPPKRK